MLIAFLFGSWCFNYCLWFFVLYMMLFGFRFHQLFKAKLGLLDEEEEDGNLIAFLLKVRLYNEEGQNVMSSRRENQTIAAAPECSLGQRL